MRLAATTLCALTLALALSSVAHAGVPTKIDFSGIAANTEIRDQYANLDLDPNVANEGVLFGPPARFGFPDEFQCGVYAHTGSDAISGVSAYNGCSDSTEFGRKIGFALRFLTTRRGVSFKVRARYPDPGYQPSFAATIRVYNSANTQIASREVTLTNAVQLVPFTRANPDIAKLTISSADPTAPRQLLLDDLEAPLDDVAPPPEFALSLSSSQLEVVEGSSAETPVTVERYNGSAGAVTLNVPELPPGIAATQVTPNPVTGIAPASLRVTAASPLTGDRQIAVTATGSSSAGTFVGGAVRQNVRAISALAVPDSQQVGLVPSCGDGRGELFANVRGNYSGRVDVYLTKSSGPAVLVEGVVTRNAAGNGTLRFPFTLRQAPGNGDSSIVEARIVPQNATQLRTAIRVFSHPLRITGSPASVAQPTYLGSGSDTREIELTGDFPDAGSCNVTYRDGRNRDLTVVRRIAGANGAPDRLVLRLPVQPVSTIVRALAPASNELGRSQRIEVQGYRNGPALPFGNSSPNAGTPNYSWDDFKRDFGSDDADNCYPIVGCSRDGDAWDVYQGLKTQLANQTGLCFGYSTLAMRFSRGLDRPRTYDSAANRAFDIGSIADGSLLKQTVVHWQLSQQDSDWANYINDLQKSTPSADQFRQSLEASLRRDGSTAVAFWQGTGGHAVVAYDVRNPSPSGGYDILTYNPNFPYNSGEEFGLNAPPNLQTSVINVQPNGQWTANVTGGAPWMGNLARMEILDRPADANIDIDEGFLAEIFGAPGVAATTSIVSAGKEALAPDGTALPGSGVKANYGLTGRVPEVDYELERGRTYDVTVTGISAGEYEHRLGGPGTGASIEGVTTAPGQKDVLTVRPGEGSLGWATSAANSSARLAVHATSGGVRREATVALGAARGQEQQVAITPSGAVTLRHAGPATKVVATLEATGSSGPAAVTTRPIAVGAAGRVELLPASWRDLSRGARLTVRDNRGRVVRRGRAPLVATARVGLGRSIRAKLRSGRGSAKVTVSGSVSKPGAAPLLVVRVETLRGDRVVAQTGVSGRGTDQVRSGRFSLPIKLKKLPRGAKVRVRVSLTDESADFATVSRTTQARG